MKKEWSPEFNYFLKMILVLMGGVAIHTHTLTHTEGFILYPLYGTSLRVG